MSIVIRPIQSGDIPQAGKLLYESWHSAFSPYMPVEMIARITLESSIAAWQRIFKLDSQTLTNLGAFEGTILLGTATAGNPRENVGFEREIWAMHVAPEVQRKAIGTTLFHAILKDSNMNGSQSHYLCCIEKNFKAMQFYLAMGGTLIPEKLDRGGYTEVRFAWM